jgi:hypothetical protein
LATRFPKFGDGVPFPHSCGSSMNGFHD